MPAGNTPRTQAPRRGPATWLTVLITLAAVGVIGLTFATGAAVGVVLGARLDRTEVAAPAAPAPNPADTAPDNPTDSATNSATDRPTGSNPGTADLDPCLVGTWEVTSHTETYSTEQGDIAITDVKRTLTITPDGTEVVMYPGDVAAVTIDQGTAGARFEGTLTYRVRTSGNTLSFELVESAATLTLISPDGTEKQQDLKPGTGDVTYTCSDEEFRQQATGYESVMRRTG